jgi:hypothetical protein
MLSVLRGLGEPNKYVEKHTSRPKAYAFDKNNPEHVAAFDATSNSEREIAMALAKDLKSQGVAEAGKRFVDPELARTKQYAKQHYPGMADPESAFDKWVTRSLMHSDRDDHDQDKRLQQLAADIAAVKTKIQALQQNADYLDESR